MCLINEDGYRTREKGEEGDPSSNLAQAKQTY